MTFGPLLFGCLRSGRMPISQLFLSIPEFNSTQLEPNTNTTEVGNPHICYSWVYFTLELDKTPTLFSTFGKIHIAHILLS
jgi:hypothetical protein